MTRPVRRLTVYTSGPASGATLHVGSDRGRVRLPATDRTLVLEPVTGAARRTGRVGRPVW